MPRKVTPSPRGVWKLVGRAQRLGLSRGMRGKGGPWLALGIGAWGLQRVRGMAAKDTEILLREPIAPGERIVITNETVTRAEADRRAKQGRREAKAADRQARRSRRRA